MKKRIGFVSNSSSSSFVCDVCGREESGWDMDLSEAEMFECENGHIFCESHAMVNVTSFDVIKDFVEKEKVKEDSYYKEEVDKFYQMLNSEDHDNSDIEEEFCDWGLYGDGRYSIPSKNCPICQMEHVTDKDMVAYLLKVSETTRDKVKQEMKEKFKDYKDLKDFNK